MNNTGFEKLSRLLMSDFKHGSAEDQLGEERGVVRWRETKMEGGD